MEPHNQESLRAHLADWTDWDGAMAILATAIGLIPHNEMHGGEKWVFWSNNPYGNFLYRTLEGLVEIGCLEQRDEPDDQFRWNPDFDLDDYHKGKEAVPEDTIPSSTEKLFGTLKGGSKPEISTDEAWRTYAARKFGAQDEI